MNRNINYEDLLVKFIEENDYKGLTNYLIGNSNLPGRMANLKLISTVADIFESNERFSKSWYSTLNNWFNNKVDGNSSETILVLTALESFGGMYNSFSLKDRLLVEDKLIVSLNDERWRVREIVTESYKRIGLLSYEQLIRLFRKILSKKPTPLEIRGLLATVAHPILLVSKEQLNFSQKIMEISFDYYLTFEEEKFSKEDKLVLKKGLSFAPSVIVSKNPISGFFFFKRLIENNDKEVKILIKENLKKKRLSNKFPNEVTNLLSMINK